MNMSNIFFPYYILQHKNVECKAFLHNKSNYLFYEGLLK